MRQEDWSSPRSMDEIWFTYCSQIAELTSLRI